MEKLRETWVFSQNDFQGRIKRLDESEMKAHNISSTRLQESVGAPVTTSAVLAVANKLREACSPEEQSLIDKIIEVLNKEGVTDTFKVWRLPVARYDHKNLNGRIYPKKLWQNISDNQRDAWCGLCGLADHPVGDNDPGLFRDQAVVWHDMDIDDDGTVYGYASFVGPYGHMAQEILEHGGRVGTSSSGFGDVNKVTKIVDPETYIVERLADLVLNPSQGTYGSINCSHGANNFMKDLSKPAVIDYESNKVKEAAAPMSQILAAKQHQYDAANTNGEEEKAMAETTQVKESVEQVEESKKLSRVEEKAFRQYVEGFVARANEIENPVKKLNECVDILECFKEGNAPDLKESVEATIVELKTKLESLVESAVDTEKDFGMSIKEFREAAERNTAQGIMLNEQVEDLNVLVEALKDRNAELSLEITNLKEENAALKADATKAIKESNSNAVKASGNADRLSAEVTALKGKNDRLMEKVSKLSTSNAKFEKENGVLNTKLKEAGRIIMANKQNRLKEAENTSKEITTARKTIKTLRGKVETLSEAAIQLNKVIESQQDEIATLTRQFENYKKEVADKYIPSTHIMPKAEERIGKFLNMRENKGVEIEAYWQDLCEQYDPKLLQPFEHEIRDAKTLKEATTAFLRNRNKIDADAAAGQPVDYAFASQQDRARVYESIGMYNPMKEYANSSTEQKNQLMKEKLEQQGLY